MLCELTLITDKIMRHNYDMTSDQDKKLEAEYPPLSGGGEEDKTFERIRQNCLVKVFFTNTFDIYTFAILHCKFFS